MTSSLYALAYVLGCLLFLSTHVFFPAHSWFPNSTSEGAKLFPYTECSSYQAAARGNHTNDTVPYVASVIAGFDPRPWEEHSPSVTSPTADEWRWALEQARDAISDPANRFGFPDSSAPQGIQPAVTI